MSVDSSQTADWGSDDEFAELIDAITNRLQAGEIIDDAALCTEHPPYAARLRELLPALRLMVNDTESGGNLPSSLPLAATGIAASIPPVLGDFRIGRELGRGGMGVVYEAEQISLSKRMALKVLPLANVLDSRSLQRFQNEARAAAQLHHPHIVSVHTFGCERGVHFYAMQYIDGGDLADVISDLRRATRSTGKRATANDTVEHAHRQHDAAIHDVVKIPAGSTVRFDSSDLMATDPSKGSANHPKYFAIFARLAGQVAEGLHHAHATGIVHRDIKPSNLLLDAGGNALIADFGLAQIQGNPDLTMPGDLIGTLRYMSPEQAYAKRVVVDHRTDVYSLGVTLYELLTLRPAFEGTTKVELLRKIAFEDPRRPRQIDPRIPPALETIVMKAIAKNPDERYQTASEMGADLRHFQNGRPIAARPPSLARRTGKWASRHKALVTAIGVAMVGLFVAAVSLAFTLSNALTTETERRKDVEQLWRRSEGLRAAANASLQVADNPGQALGLAVVAAELHPSPETNRVLQTALDLNHEKRTLLGHASPLGTARFDPTGTRVVTTATSTWFNRDAEAARIWSVADGQFIRLEDTSTITSAAFSPGGGRVLTASSPGVLFAKDDMDGELKGRPPAVWDANRGQKLYDLKNAFLFEAHPAAFSSSGRWIVTPALGKIAVVWDALEGLVRFRLVGHEQRVYYAGYSPDGTRIVTMSDDNTVRIWNSDDGRLLRTFDQWQAMPLPLPIPGPLIRSAAISPDGRRLLTNTKSFQVELWDIESGVRINKDNWVGGRAMFGPSGDRIAHDYLSKQTDIRDAASGKRMYRVSGALQGFSPDGRLLATVNDDVIQLWHAATGELATELRGHDTAVNTAAISPDSHHVVSAAEDHTARIWTVESGAELSQFAERIADNNQTIVTPSHDGKQLLIAGSPQRHTAVWEMPTLQRLYETTGQADERNVSEPRFVTFDYDRATVWNYRTGEQVGSIRSHVGEFRETRLSEDGEHVLAIVEGGPVWLWQVATGRRITLVGHTESVATSKFRPAGNQVATAAADGYANIWDIATGRLLFSLDHEGRLGDLAYSPDGEYIATANDQNTIHVWNADSGKLITTCATPGANFNRTEFTADGSQLVAFHSSRSSKVYCYNVNDGELIQTLDGVLGRIRIAIHPHRPILAIASSESGALLWDLETDARTPLSGNTMIRCTFSKNGQKVITATESQRIEPRTLTREELDGFVQPKLEIWNVDNGQLIDTLPVDGFVQTLAVNDKTGHLYVSVDCYGATLYDFASRDRVGSIRGHAAPLSFAAFTRDGRRIVTAAWDQTAAVWDTKSGNLVHRFEGHRFAITAAAIQKNLLATGGADGTLMLWDLNSGKRQEQIQGHEDLIRSCQFDKEGRRLLTNSLDNSYRILDLTTGEVLLNRRDAVGTALSVELAPDGKGLLVVPGGLTRHSWPAMGNLELKVRAKVDNADRNVVKYYRTGAEAAELLRHDDHPLIGRFIAEGDRILTVTRDVAFIWNSRDLNRSEPIAAPRMQVHSAAVSSTGDHVLLHGTDAILLWDIASERDVLTLRPNQGFHRTPSPAFSPDGKWIIASVNRRVRTFPTDPLTLGRRRAPRELTATERKQFVLADAARIEHQ